jgi:type I restriction enzyme S subunit
MVTDTTFKKGLPDETSVKAGYKQTEIGVIPEDWDVKEISKLGEIRGRIGWKGYTVKDLRKSGPYTIGAKHINNLNQLDLSDPTHLSIEKYLESPEIMVNKGDLLIVQRGTIGKLVLIDKKIGDATINPSMAILRFRKVTESYVYYYLCSEKGQNQILQDTSSTGVPMVTQKQISNFKIPIPQTPEEQTAIATILSDTDALIECLEKLIAKKKAIKQGSMQQLLTGEKRLPGFSGEWELKKLGDLLYYEQPTKYLVKDTEYNDNNDTPVLTAGKTFILGFTNEEFGIFNNIPVIIFDDFTTANKFVTFPFKAKSSAMKILIPTGEDVNLRFVYEKMKLIDFPLGDHKRYWISEYQNLKIGIPKPKEQTAITTILSDMDAEIVSLEQKRDKYTMLKQGMMQQLLTGRIRIYANN